MSRFTVLIIVAALMIVSCAKQPGLPPPEETDTSGPLFDPLETGHDREVVPVVYPVTVRAIPDAGDSLVQPGDMSFLEYDSTSSLNSPAEVYRVQIFTSRLYAEAARERQLAEEIFNLPIHLDYEVPYYKLRVGNFLARDEAENMLSEIKTIGYRNAWVARVVLRIREAPESELPEEPILPGDSLDTIPAPTDSPDIGDGY
jgi:hypothetical protein